MIGLRLALVWALACSMVLQCWSKSLPPNTGLKDMRRHTEEYTLTNQFGVDEVYPDVDVYRPAEAKHHHENHHDAHQHHEHHGNHHAKPQHHNPHVPHHRPQAEHYKPCLLYTSPSPRDS